VGHTSWDRLCLGFLEACKWVEATDPEHMYKYFPGQDTWTWGQEATGWDVDMQDSYKACKQYNFKDEDGGGGGVAVTSSAALHKHAHGMTISDTP